MFPFLTKIFIEWIIVVLWCLPLWHYVLMWWGWKTPTEFDIDSLLITRSPRQKLVLSSAPSPKKSSPGPYHLHPVRKEYSKNCVGGLEGLFKWNKTQTTPREALEGRRRSEILTLLSIHFSVKDSGRGRVVHVGLEACLSSHRKKMQSRLHQNSGKRHRTSPRGENKLLRSGVEWQ